MKSWMQSMSKLARRFHEDEGGADMVEYILIIAAIALPILAIVIYYKNDIREWVGDQYSDIKDGEGSLGTD